MPLPCVNVNEASVQKQSNPCQQPAFTGRAAAGAVSACNPVYERRRAPEEPCTGAPGKLLENQRPFGEEMFGPVPECSRFEWIEPDESNGARLRSEATAQRDPFKLQKA